MNYDNTWYDHTLNKIILFPINLILPMINGLYYNVGHTKNRDY